MSKKIDDRITNNNEANRNQLSLDDGKLLIAYIWAECQRTATPRQEGS